MFATIVVRPAMPRSSSVFYSLLWGDKMMKMRIALGITLAITENAAYDSEISRIILR